jgi:hypothetical protein
MAARAALWDTRVPRTRAVEYRPDVVAGAAGNKKEEGDMDVDPEPQSALDTRRSGAPATDFELEDYWDDGVVLGGRDVWPVSVTLNLVILPPSSPCSCRSFLSTLSIKVSRRALPRRHNTGGGRHAPTFDPDIFLPTGIARSASRDALARCRRNRPHADRVVSKGEFASVFADSPTP